MKEDAQLICPISYDDPDGNWSKIEQLIMDRLPLREVTWRSPISSSFIRIPKLPLRFLPSDASLFKDTDHPYRWFLSQYVNLYIVVAETLDTYKTVRPNVKKWVDSINNTRSSFGKRFWIVVYLTMGNYPASHYAKVYAKIAGDFYVERSGDRSVMVSLQADPGSSMMHSTSLLSISSFQTAPAQDGYGELMSKIREGIVQSFQIRSSLYDTEIRKLDATRGTPNFDFKQLFLVKESFALLYQMMQLLDMALAQYEELEAMLAFAPPGILLDGWWPLKAPEQLKTSDMASPESARDKDIMADPVRSGDDIVSYSINLARMKVLKSKLSILELNRYVFARQMYFLVTMQRPLDCAEKARRFLVFLSQSIETRIREIVDPDEQATATFQAKLWTLTASIKCVRLCRDLVDTIISSENVAGTESTQSVAQILGVIRASQYSVSLRSSLESDFARDPSSAVDRSMRDSHLARDKMATYRETFLILASIITLAKAKFNELTPVKQFAQEKELLRLHRGLNIEQDSATSEPLEDESDADSYNANKYFHAFDDNVEARNILDKDLDSSSFNDVGGLEQVLGSISQRIRSVSHYWAKLYNTKNFGSLRQHSDNAIISESSWKVHLYMIKICQLQQSQLDKGCILEMSLACLLTLAASDIFSLCDRNASSLVERVQLANYLLCTSLYQKGFNVLQGLLDIADESQLLLNPWSSSWPDLMQKCLLMLARFSIEVKDSHMFRKSLATLGHVLISHKDFMWTSLRCDLAKVIQQLLVPRPGMDFSATLVFPADKVIAFQLLTDQYAESVDIFDQSTEVKRHGKKISAASSVPKQISPRPVEELSSVVKRRGVQLVHENPFPVLWLHCICNEGNVPLHLDVASFLESEINVDEIQICLRRVPSFGLDGLFGSQHEDDGLQMTPREEIHQSPLGDQSPVSLLPPSHAQLPQMSHKSSSHGLESFFISDATYFAIDDEDSDLWCSSKTSSTVSSNDLSLVLGNQSFHLSLVPTRLGDYVIDRFVVVVSGTTHFEHRVLKESDSDREVSSDGLPQPSSSSFVQDEDVQKYFDRFPIFRIAPPAHLLTLQLHTSSRLPPNQLDDAYITFVVPPEDTVLDIRIQLSALSKCRRWNGTPVENAPSIQAYSAVKFRPEVVGSSSARSIRDPHSGYLYDAAGLEMADDEASNGHYLVRDFAILVAAVADWNCWEEDIFVASSSTSTTSTSLSQRRPVECLVMDDNTLLIRNIAGGRKVTIKVPLTVRTSLLTGVVEEFTLQAPVQLHFEGVMRKGPCLVPFRGSGCSSVLCCNVLKGNVLQELQTTSSNSCIKNDIFSGGHHFAQLQIVNIHHFPLHLIGLSFLNRAGEAVDASLVGKQDVRYPEDLQLVCDVSELSESQDGVNLSLAPQEIYFAFVQTSAALAVSCVRLYYRRSYFEPLLSSMRATATPNIFYVDIPYTSHTGGPQGGDHDKPGIVDLGDITVPKENCLVSLRPTQQPVKCSAGEVILLKARVSIRGRSSRAYHYFIDEVHPHPDTMNLHEFRSSVLLNAPDSQEEDLDHNLRCTLPDTEEWMAVGVVLSKYLPGADSDSSSYEFQVDIALIPVLAGLFPLPPLVMESSEGDEMYSELVLPHSMSSLTHAHVSCFNPTTSISSSCNGGDEVQTTPILFACFDEVQI